MANMYEPYREERARYKLDEEERARQKQDEGSSSRQNVVQGSSSIQNEAEGSSSIQHEAEESSLIQNVGNEEILNQKVERETSKKGVKKFLSFLKIGSSKKKTEISSSGDTEEEEEGSGKKLKKLLSGLSIGSYRKKKEEKERLKAEERESMRRNIELGIDDDHPYGFDEFHNYTARNLIPYPDDDLSPGSSLNLHCLGHEIYNITRYDWHDIITGTQNRARAQFLSRGNYGDLYRCDDPDSNSVAVKFHDPVALGHQEFMAEIKTLLKTNHENVIKLLGASFGRDELALLYEFMPGGSLDQFILKDERRAMGFPDNNRLVLNWEMRMSIAEGVAKALAYLHNELNLIHRDVTLGDVLLDEELKPKLANFELSVEKVIDVEFIELESQMNPETCKGTPGCTAPETEESGAISTKCDVYSYGVLLFQLFSGLKALDFRRPARTWNLADWMGLFWSGEVYVPLIIDDAIRYRYSDQGLKRIYEIARMCTNRQARLRPNMGQVVTMVSEAASHQDHSKILH